jgi:hypothetical protein
LRGIVEMEREKRKRRTELLELSPEKCSFDDNVNDG